MSRFDEALAAYDSALAIKPDYPECHLARGDMMKELRQFEEAFAAYDKTFSLRPDLPFVEGARLSTKMQICDWDNLDAERAHLLAGVRRGELRSDPFRLFGLSGSAADQLICAQAYIAKEFPARAEPIWRGERYRHDRIRLAYISADFRNHAVAFLIGRNVRGP